MVIKVIMLVVFFGIMIGVGFYARKQATDVNGFVLGGRSVGPWLQHLHMVRPIFRQLFLLGMQDSLDGNTELHPHGSELEMRSLDLCLHG